METPPYKNMTCASKSDQATISLGWAARTMPCPDRSHLRRLANVWIRSPLYFLTACTRERRPVLIQADIPKVLIEAWQASPDINGWVIGRYVIMPDHVHFFTRPQPDSKPLGAFVRDWKKWTARRITTSLAVNPPVWQPEFFDHILRSAGSYSEKWEYVRQNPVRAGLAATPDAWPYSGECEKLPF
ncbi:MAG: REP-associated tyrosine transposase [Opitutales bacterium]